jgi:hypothetical protein
LHHGNKDKRRRRSSMETSANVTHTPDSINEGEGDNVSHGINVDFERPIGRKAEKANRKRKERPSKDVVEFMKIMNFERKRLHLQGLEWEEKMDIERKKLQSEQLDREERTMILDTSNMTELQQQYWKARQNEIIECQESRKST